MVKTTLVLGASPNPDRFSFRAVKSLQRRGIPVIAVGKREGKAGDIQIFREIPSPCEPVHTVALYMNAQNQEDYYDSIIALKPKRIIFNPGTANPELEEIARKNGIASVEGCLLDMLSSGKF